MENYFKDLLIVKELIYCKENLLIYQNKTFCNQSFCKSSLFTSQISFKIALTDVKATLKQHWYNVISTLKQRWNDIEQRWKTVALTLCNVDLTLFQRCTPTLYQCCATLKIRFRILFHFQRRLFERWSTMSKNVDPTLRCWLGSIYEKVNS